MPNRPVVNTHVHFPPNFSAFESVADAIQAACDEGVGAIGISNFFDQHVYQDFARAAQGAGIVALFGLEFITLDDELADAGIRVNDPANPGRFYLCGKGISWFKDRSPEASSIAAEIRSGNDRRAAQMVARLAEWFARCGLETGLTAAGIQAEVAEAAGVPVEWVSIQERHIATAFQARLAELSLADRIEVLTRAYTAPPAIDVDNPVALQGELRARLMKIGTVGFVPETRLSFADAYSYVLQMDGIPTYPTLGDGANPICQFEDPPTELADQLLRRGIYAAELIPNRNTRACCDAYVKAFTEAGIIVMAGTEHNTSERIPLDPTCSDAAVSDFAREAFWQGTCVVAAHQAEVAAGRAGYVDPDGERTSIEVAELARIGAEIITGRER